MGKFSLRAGQILEHYKGNRYEVLAIGLHSETEEELVVYQALYEDPVFGKGAIWIRPVSMFFEEVQHKDEIKPRFCVIEEKA